MPPAPPVDSATAAPDEAEGGLLLVSLHGAVVALPATQVVEILPARPYARIPGAPAAIAGVVNRRGRMLTVVDLGAALGAAPTAVEEGHRVVVLIHRGRELGLAVRDVLQITQAWWADGGEREGEGAEAAPPGRQEEVTPSADAEARSEARDGGADEQLRIVELEALLDPLFGGEDHHGGDTTSERS